MTNNGPMAPQDSNKRNLRLGLILASVALMFFLGFVTKIVLLSHP